MVTITEKNRYFSGFDSLSVTNAKEFTNPELVVLSSRAFLNKGTIISSNVSMVGITSQHVDLQLDLLLFFLTTNTNRKKTIITQEITKSTACLNNDFRVLQHNFGLITFYCQLILPSIKL